MPFGSKLALVYFFVAQEVNAKNRIEKQRILITFILGKEQQNAFQEWDCLSLQYLKNFLLENYFTASLSRNRANQFAESYRAKFLFLVHWEKFRHLKFL